MTKDTHPPADVNLVMQELQHKVQRKLGECMLRLMMFEGLLKRMLGNIHIAATPKQIPSEAERAARVSRETLGALISAFINGHLVTDDSSTGASHDESAPSPAPGDPWFSMKFAIGSGKQHWYQSKAKTDGDSSQTPGKK